MHHPSPSIQEHSKLLEAQKTRQDEIKQAAKVVYVEMKVKLKHFVFYFCRKVPKPFRK